MRHWPLVPAWKSSLLSAHARAGELRGTSSSARDRFALNRAAGTRLAQAVLFRQRSQSIGDTPHLRLEVVERAGRQEDACSQWTGTARPHILVNGKARAQYPSHLTGPPSQLKHQNGTVRTPPAGPRPDVGWSPATHRPRTKGPSHSLMPGSVADASEYFWGMATRPRQHWVIVLSREHARRGVTGGFVMANHGKRAPLARMSRGDGILMYSPTTSYPSGEPLRAVTVVGEVSGNEPEPSDVIAGGFCRVAKLREIQPLPLQQIRAHLPVSRLRFGFFELSAADAEAILALASPIPH